MTEAEHRLRERVKELNGLYGLSQLVEANPNDLDPVLQGLVELIPSSWQYPEAATAQVVFRGRVFETQAFDNTRWMQVADIDCDGIKVGTLSVAYTKHFPKADDGPFLAEERALINELAERLGHVAERLDRDAALQLAHRQLRAE
ncbi:MAG: LuxR family transcriptional regulator, partial [Deltaproteobacteria bacterium]|nr:LuxR family transcriptional regulator [Deltaproteobacteria bacterium]